MLRAVFKLLRPSLEGAHQRTRPVHPADALLHLAVRRGSGQRVEPISCQSSCAARRSGFGGLLNVRCGSIACQRMQAILESVLCRQLSMTGAVFRAYSPGCTAKRFGPAHPARKPGIVFWNETLA